MKKILGIGNALVDVILFMEDDKLLNTFSLPRGSMQLVDAGKALRVEETAGMLKKHLASGGSAANTIHGLANLGVETAFIGTVGNDPMGTFFEKDLRDSGINPILAHSQTNTGRAISLVLPGGERTFATYLGAALEMDAGQLDPDQFSPYAHLHLEGYLVPNRQLTESAFAIARQLGMTVSLDLASYNVVEENIGFLKQVIGRYNPVVFANEEEARAFTGQEDPRKALEVIASVCDTAIVKTGAKGSLVCHRGKNYMAEAIPVNCIDTTGAGDLYAAGYLYGYINDFDPEKCGRLGSLLAGKVIEEPGAKISPASWNDIRTAVRTSRV